RVAQLAGRRLRTRLDREMAAVTQAHAIGALARRVTIPALEERRVSGPAVAVAPRRRGVPVMAGDAEQEIKYSLRGSTGSRRHNTGRREQTCRQAETEWSRESHGHPRTTSTWKRRKG